MSTPEPRRCTVPLLDGSPCERPYYAADKCRHHYDRARPERRDMRPRAALGPVRDHLEFEAPDALGARVRGAAKAARLDVAAWLREACEAKLTAVK